VLNCFIRFGLYCRVVFIDEISKENHYQTSHQFYNKTMSFKKIKL
jgi:hypothetical protein